MDIDASDVNGVVVKKKAKLEEANEDIVKLLEMARTERSKPDATTIKRGSERSISNDQLKNKTTQRRDGDKSGECKGRTS